MCRRGTLKVAAKAYKLGGGAETLGATVSNVYRWVSL